MKQGGGQDAVDGLRDDASGAGSAPGGSRGRTGLGLVLMALLLLGMLAATLGANSWKKELPVRTVSVEGNAILSTAEVLSIAGIPKTARLFDLDLATVRNRLLQNPFVRTVSVNREGSAGVLIVLEERVPLAALVSEQLLYIDDEGYVLPAARSDRMYDLPVLTGALPAADCKPGRRIVKPAVLQALDLLLLSREFSDELYRGISEISVRDDGELVLYTSDAGVPVIVGQGDLPVKLAKFNGFWGEVVARRGPQQLQYVDLRFEDQVVVRWNGSPAQP
jgi:cell division protein FtsQ